MSTQAQEHEQTARANRSARHGPTPMRIRKILVPVDFSEGSSRALDYALGFAEKFDAALVLLHVVEPAAGGEHYHSAQPALDETNDHLLAEGKERLAELSHKRCGHRNGVETLARIGRAHSEIADTARALGVDLIVIGSHGETSHLPLGGTADRVLRHAACPVLTVRTHGD